MQSTYYFDIKVRSAILIDTEVAMTNSRRIGAGFEQKVARMLLDELNIHFKRNLEQYREVDLGDLICDEDNWKWVIECKRRKSGTTYSMDWWEQVTTAAQKQDKMPVLIYQLNRSPIRCVVDLNEILRVFNGDVLGHVNLVELTFETFCMIARETLHD